MPHRSADGGPKNGSSLSGLCRAWELGNIWKFTIHPSPICHASSNALGLVTCCRSLRSSTLHPVILVRVRSVRGPRRPGAHWPQVGGARLLRESPGLDVDENCAGAFRVPRRPGAHWPQVGGTRLLRESPGLDVDENCAGAVRVWPPLGNWRRWGV